MTWAAVLGIAVGLVGPVMGFAGAMWSAERQHDHQIARDNAAAGRDYAWRADEHFRPYLYDVLASARAINLACVARYDDVGDLRALDRCIDRLDSSPLTREVAVAATEMRSTAEEYRAGWRTLQMLNEQMPTQGGPLRPDVGAEVVAQANRVSVIRDAVFAGTFSAREAVKRVVVQLEGLQRGES